VLYPPNRMELSPLSSSSFPVFPHEDQEGMQLDKAQASLKPFWWTAAK